MKSLKRLLLILCILSITVDAHAALTKSTAEVDAWLELTQPGVREGATVDISPNYQTTLLIDVCLSEAVAETAGATIYVEISSNTTGDADWEVLASFGGPTGTAESEALSGDEAQSQTVLSVTDPDTANLDNPSRFIFFEDTASAANSEIIFEVSNQGNAGDTITVLDGLTTAHAAATSLMWFIDSATTGSNAVAQYVVNIPDTAYRVRVIYDSTHATAADIFTRARLIKITGI
jgi:hypothetical protein